VKKGDYCLATKYLDGDPLDHWCVGFYDRKEYGRHFVVDMLGNQFRGNGFRKVAKISREMGDFFLGNVKKIEASNIGIWEWLNKKEKIIPLISDDDMVVLNKPPGRRCPIPDFNGLPIYEGDVVTHESGEQFELVYHEGKWGFKRRGKVND
jgi:hypothetical protein